MGKDGMGYTYYYIPIDEVPSLNRSLHGIIEKTSTGVNIQCKSLIWKER